MPELADHDSTERAALIREDRLVVAEFLTELSPLEQRVFWLMAEGMKYRSIAKVLNVEINAAHNAERSSEKKRKHFQLLYDTGRLCGYRATTIRALQAGESTSEELAKRAFAHLESCASCRAEHRTNARRLRRRFQGQAAILLPVPTFMHRLGWFARLDARLRTLQHRLAPDGLPFGSGGVRERAAAILAGSGAAAKVAATVTTVAVIAGTIGATHILDHEPRDQPHRAPPSTARASRASVTPSRPVSAPILPRIAQPRHRAVSTLRRQTHSRPIRRTIANVPKETLETAKYAARTGRLCLPRGAARIELDAPAGTCACGVQRQRRTVQPMSQSNSLSVLRFSRSITREPLIGRGPDRMEATMNKNYKAAPRRGALLLAVTLLLLAGAGNISTSSAHADSWIEDSCQNPNGSAAPSQGWSTFASGSIGSGSNANTVCGPGDPMVAELSSNASDPVGAGENMQYTPPAGSTLAGGSADVYLNGQGYGTGASGVAIIYSPEFQYNGANVLIQCSSGQPACSNGPTPYIYSGLINIPTNRGGNFYIGTGCGGESVQSCNEGASEGAWALARLWWADFLLTNNSTPGASDIGGTLLAPNARGTQELTLTATDPGGPGVYTVTVEVDGKASYSGTPNTNGGECMSTGSSGGVLMFDYSQPCRQSEALDIPINTTQLADGQHTLKITVQDAAQNSSVVYDNTVTTKNAPASSSLPTILAPSQVFTEAALSTHPGTWEAPASAGTITYGYQWESCDTEGNNCQTITGAQNATYTPTPAEIGHTLRVSVSASDNDGLTTTTSAATSVVLSTQGTLGAPNGPGTGPGGSPGTGGGPSGTGEIVGQGNPNGNDASEAATIHLGVRHRITRTFARRALKIPGRLLDNHGYPITGAELDVLQQSANSATMRVIAHTRTQSNGTFLVHVPTGPSRLVEVAYRAFSADTNYTSTGEITESVAAGVRLKIAPRQTYPNGTIVLTGRVLGPVPGRGTIVDLLVHYRGQWVPFRTPRTEPDGHFEVEYQFEGGIGRFPFRAVVPAGQAGFPFSSGRSNMVDVTTS